MILYIHQFRILLLVLQYIGTNKFQGSVTLFYIGNRLSHCMHDILSCLNSTSCIRSGRSLNPNYVGFPDVLFKYANVVCTCITLLAYLTKEKKKKKKKNFFGERSTIDGYNH